MLYTKPLVSVMLLWSAFFHLVNADFTWSFNYLPPDLVQATIDGTVPPCGFEDNENDNAGYIQDLTVLCNGKKVFRHPWKGETPLYLLPGRDFPHIFTLPCNDRVFPVGISCQILLRVECQPTIRSPQYTRQ